MTFAPPTGLPVELPAPQGHFTVGDWACWVYLHPTKRNSVRFVAKNMKIPHMGINVDLAADRLANFDPDKFWKGQVS